MTKEEVRKKLLDKDYRMGKFYTITTKNAGEKVRFNKNKAQTILFEMMLQYRRIIILKSRQLGITTGICMSFLDDVLFNKNISALSLFHIKEKAIDAFDNKVRFAWENFNPDLRDALEWRVDTERANQLKFDFKDGSSSSYSIATTGRSGTFHRVHVSEFGALCTERPLDAKELITGTFPSVPEDGLIVIESTANGEVGYFPDMWNDAVAGRSDFKPLFLNWRYDVEEIAKSALIPLEAIPDEFLDLGVDHGLSHQEISFYYGKFKLLNRDWVLLRQEYPTTPEEAFQGSGEKLFDMEAIAEYEKQTVEVQGIPLYGGFLKIYGKYRFGKAYVIGGDPSEGVDNDDSAAVVWEIDGIKPRVVATFQSKVISPEDFAYLLRKLANDYGNAAIAVERNGPGLVTLSKLKEIYREDLIYRPIEEGRINPKISLKLGFETTSMSKPFILNTIAQAVKDREVGIMAKELLTEMRICPKGEMLRLTLTNITRHFDMLMAAAIGLHARAFALERCGAMTAITTVTSHQSSEPDLFSPV